MNVCEILVAIGIAFGFTAWPLLAKFSQAGAAWAGAITLGTSLILFVILSRREFIAFPTSKAVAVLLSAGAINGVGVFFYTRNATNPEASTAIFLVAVSVFMAAWVPVLDFGLNGTIPSLRQIIGFFCAGGAIYLLNK